MRIGFPNQRGPVYDVRIGRGLHYKGTYKVANNIYEIDLLATAGSFIDVTDDGTGIDWLVIKGSYATATDIRLNYSNNRPANDAAGSYTAFSSGTGTQTSTLRVHGVIENVRGCDSVDVIVGNALDNVIFGDQDRIGVGANDTLSGADGNDAVYGGSGLDVVYGGAGNDILFGDAGADSITGDAGVDTIEGGAGADTLSGGDDVGDTLSYAASAAGVQISITHGATTIAIGGDAEGDSISTFRDVFGSAFGDTLIDTDKGTISFGYNDNRFDGGAGDDRLDMGGGNDTAIGGAGNDTLLGEDGRDRLFGGSGDDSLSGGAAADILGGGAGNDTLSGGIGADNLSGGLGNDVIRGGAGRDSLIGSSGADTLTGNSGQDFFIFTSAADSTTLLAGRDTITDFHHVEADRINLHAIDANTNTANVNDDFTTIVNAATFTGNSTGALHFHIVTGGILVEGDTDGDHVANFAIFLQGISTITTSDFIF